MVFQEHKRFISLRTIRKADHSRKVISKKITTYGGKGTSKARKGCPSGSSWSFWAPIGVEKGRELRGIQATGLCKHEYQWDESG